MKTAIVIETPDNEPGGEWANAGEIAADYADLIRQSAADDGVPVTVTTEVSEPAPAPQPYDCTAVIRMPADDGQALRPEDVTTFLQEHGAQLIEWHDEDLIGAVDRCPHCDSDRGDGYCQECGEDRDE